MSCPRRLLLDEGQSLLLVEQAAHLSLGLADWVYMLENGRIARSGAAAAIRDDDSLPRSYLGL